MSTVKYLFLNVDISTSLIKHFNAVASLINLECHLQQFSSAKSHASNMLKDLRSHMKDILDLDSNTFNTFPASVPLLQPLLSCCWSQIWQDCSMLQRDTS